MIFKKIREKINNKVSAIRLSKACNNGLMFNTKVDTKEVQRDLSYENIGYNVFFKNRGSGATRFVLVASFMKAVKNSNYEIVIVNKNLGSICKSFYKKDSSNIKSVSNKRIDFYNGSKIVFITNKEVSTYKGDPDHIYVDDYNLTFTFKSAKIFKRFTCPITRVYRRGTGIC